jgi:hypothetical protein
MAFAIISSTTSIVRPPSAPRRVFTRAGVLLITVTFIDPPEPRSYECQDVRSLCDLAIHYLDRTPTSAADRSSIFEVQPGGMNGSLNAPLGLLVFVWASMSRVMAVLNERDYRDETITLKLRQSDGFGRVEALAMKGPMTQREIIDLLRTDINGLYEPIDLVARLREVRVINDSKGAASLAAGKESISQSVQREVVGAASLPEDVVLTVPV